MPKFLHEYSRYANGQVIENGWWEIRGNKLFNSAGGHHDYYPRPDDEIREGTWEEIMRDYLLDNSQITGWIAPDGTFYGCKPEAHSGIAYYVLNARERELEERGFVKIFKNPEYLLQRVSGVRTYEAIRCDYKPMTAAQRKVLDEKGVFYHEYQV